MKAETYMKQSSAKSKIIAMVLLAGVLPFLVSVAAHFIIVGIGASAGGHELRKGIVA